MAELSFLKVAPEEKKLLGAKAKVAPEKSGKSGPKHKQAYILPTCFRVPRLVAFFGSLSKSSSIPTFSEELILLMRPSTIYLVIGPKLTDRPGLLWPNRGPFIKIHVK